MYFAIQAPHENQLTLMRLAVLSPPYGDFILIVLL